MSELKLGYFYTASDFLTKELKLKNSIVRVISKLGQTCSIETIDGRAFALSTILLSQHLNESKSVEYSTTLTHKKTIEPKLVIKSEPEEIKSIAPDSIINLDPENNDQNQENQQDNLDPNNDSDPYGDQYI